MSVCMYMIMYVCMSVENNLQNHWSNIKNSFTNASLSWVLKALCYSSKTPRPKPEQHQVQSSDHQLVLNGVSKNSFKKTV